VSVFHRKLKRSLTAHSALFLDKADDDGIFPRIFPDKDEATVYRTFNTFYSFNVSYQLTRQWIWTPGPFEYGYRWLSSSGTRGFQELCGP
jgi:hypothetical protein